MAGNKIFEYLLSGISNLTRLGKGGPILKGNLDHIEFKNSTDTSRLPVRVPDPVDLQDAVNLQYLRDQVLMNYGKPVQDLAELKAIISTERRDKQIRYVEDERASFQFDAESTATVPDANDPTLVYLPDDITDISPGRWIKTRARVDSHTELLDLNADDHPQYQLRTEKNQINGYVGFDGAGLIQSDTDKLPEGVSNLYHTQARVLASLISTLNILDSAIANGDSIEVAIGKAQGQINRLTTDLTGLFGSKTTDDLNEGATNLYFSVARVLTTSLIGIEAIGGTYDLTLPIVDTDFVELGIAKNRNRIEQLFTDLTALFSTKTTDDLAEGVTNLYFSGKTTADLPENTNLYFTEARVLTSAIIAISVIDASIINGDSINVALGKAQGQIDRLSTDLSGLFASKTTDDLAEGITNKYFSGKTTTDLPEGTNLYHTTARVNSVIQSYLWGKLLNTGYLLTIDASLNIAGQPNGANGQILSSDSTQNTGLKWIDPPASIDSTTDLLGTDNLDNITTHGEYYVPAGVSNVPKANVTYILKVYRRDSNTIVQELLAASEDHSWYRRTVNGVFQKWQPMTPYIFHDTVASSTNKDYTGLINGEWLVTVNANAWFSNYTGIYDGASFTNNVAFGSNQNSGVAQSTYIGKITGNQFRIQHTGTPQRYYVSYQLLKAL